MIAICPKCGSHRYSLSESQEAESDIVVKRFLEKRGNRPKRFPESRLISGLKIPRVYRWNKEVDENVIVCPDCGERWSFVRKPLYILTGCSGIGKTVTAGEIQKRIGDFVVLDADLFYNIMLHDTEKGYFAQVESLSLGCADRGNDFQTRSRENEVQVKKWIPENEVMFFA